MNMLCSGIRLAFRDWLYEFRLSLCAVLALASMMAPLLILHGVHNGVIERLRETLMSDPAVLVLMPSGGKGAGFTEAFIAELGARPECAYAVGRTRDVASELSCTSPSGARLQLTLEPTGQGDPMLARNGFAAPRAELDGLEIVLSSTAAGKLGVHGGDVLQAAIARRSTSGRLMRVQMDLRVTGVLPKGATGMDTGFVAEATLNAIQDFRDGITVPLLGTEGELPPPAERRYESFRAYAGTLDDVERLEKWCADAGVTVRTRSRDIANIRRLDSTLGSVIGIIAAATGAGFLAFMVSNADAAVRRKWKMLAMLRLLGYPRASLLAYPLAQALLTGLLGVLLAGGAYLGIAFAIDTFFAEATNGWDVCVIPAADFLIAGALVEALVMAGTLRGAVQASRIEPSAVIREL